MSKALKKTRNTARQNVQNIAGNKSLKFVIVRTRRDAEKCQFILIMKQMNEKNETRQLLVFNCPGDQLRKKRTVVFEALSTEALVKM